MKIEYNENKYKFNHIRILVEICIASILYTLMGLAGAFYYKYLIDTILADGLVKTLHIISTDK